MGREIKRVAAGFDWPVNEIWKGFINPHWKPCPEDNKTCFGGATAASRWMDAICRFLGMVASGEMMHPYITEFPQAPHYKTPRDVIERANKIKNDDAARMRVFFDYDRLHPRQVLPLTPELCDAFIKFSGVERSDFSLYGSGTGSYAIQKKILKAAGVDIKTFGKCPICKGEGVHPDALADYEAWEQEEPPAGDWWQVWETVSEGSPVTPAFATDAELIDYLVANGDAWDQKRGDGGWKRANAEKFVNSGWAPSAAILESGAIVTARDGGI